jgi:tetratricopeptide (TPR) repeat protein
VQEYVLHARAAWNNPPARDNYLRVISLLDHALALDPWSVDAQIWVEAVFAGRILNGMSDSTTADIERAEALAARVLSVSPRRPLVHLAKGQVLRAQNRYEEAIPEYGTVLAFNRKLAARDSLAWLVQVLDRVHRGSHPASRARYPT